MVEESPLVSIIMPVYNCASTISEAIDSIINQTYKNWELIVCDDGSQDETLSILYGYKNQLDKRLVILKNKNNSKIAATLNHCLKYAKGKYIARMDGDDRSKQRRLEKQVEYMETHPEIDCVGTGIEVFDCNGVRGYRMGQEFPDKKTIFKQVPFAHPTIMMKKEVYDNLRGYRVSRDIFRAEDIDLWFRFWEKGYKGYNIQEVLLEYRERETDYSKRSLKAAYGITKISIYYFIVDKYNMINLLYCFKPLVAAIIPSRIMYLYHNKKMNRRRLKG